jgi:hypothetical protein
MMMESPCYHFQAEVLQAKLEGQEAIKSLYRMGAETNQSIFFVNTSRSPSPTISLLRPPTIINNYLELR